MGITAIAAQGQALKIYAGIINNDAVQSIVYATYDGYIYCQRESDNTILWSYSIGSLVYDLVTYDIDGDSALEIFIAAANGSMYVLSSTGTLLFQYDTTEQVPLFQVTVGRKSGGIKQIYTTGASKKMYVMTYSGSTYAYSTSYNLSAIHSDRAAFGLRTADIDSDNTDEVFIVTDVGQLGCWDPDTAASFWSSPTRVSLYLEDTSTPFISKGLYVGQIGSTWVAMITGAAGASEDWQILNLHTSSSSVANRFYVRNSNSTSANWQMVHIPLIGDFDNPNPQQVVDVSGYRIYRYTKDGTAHSGEYHDPTLVDSAVQTNLTRHLIPFSDACVQADGDSSKDAVYLASGLGGDNRIYKLTFSSAWYDDVKNATPSGLASTIDTAISGQYNQVSTMANSIAVSSQGSRYFLGVIAGEATSNGDITSLLSSLPTTATLFGNPSFITFVSQLSIAQTGGVPGVGTPDISTSSYATIMGMMSYATTNYPNAKFYITVAHLTNAYMPVATLEDIINAAPGLLGFIISETNTTNSAALETFFDDYVYDVLDLCVTYSKKLTMFASKNTWLTIVHMAQFNQLVDGRYKDVLVPSAEPSDSFSDDISMSARFGLYVGGAVNQFGERFIEDSQSWTQLHAYVGLQENLYLRQMIQAVLCGATYLDLKAFYTSSGSFTKAGQYSIGFLVKLLHTNILTSPSLSNMVGLSKCAIRIREPNSDFIDQARYHDDDDFTSGGENANGVFLGIAPYRAGSNTASHTIQNNVFGKQRQVSNMICITKYGYPVIIPSFISTSSYRYNGFTNFIDTDGVSVYDDNNNALTGSNALSHMLSKLNAAKNNMLFTQSTDRIFMQVFQTTTRTYTVILMDGDFLDPSDKSPTITIKATEIPNPTTGTITDLLSGSISSLTTNSFSTTISAGSFRAFSIYLGAPELLTIEQTDDSTITQRIKNDYVSFVIANINEHDNTQLQIIENYEANFNNPLISIKSSDGIQTNGNLVKLTKNNIRIILKHNTTYKYRIRLRINGEWQPWTETASFRTRDKDYKYTR